MTPPRRRWSFTLRTLLVALAISVVWFGTQLSVIQRRKAAIERLQAAGGKSYAWELLRIIKPRPLPVNVKLRSLVLRDAPIGVILVPDQEIDEMRGPLTALFPEALVGSMSNPNDVVDPP